MTPSAAANVTLVVVEHARTPYAARLVLAPVELAANATSRQRVALDPSWDVERLGIVAIARAGEAVQSATWMLAQDEPTVQARKAVLVEHVSASWCDPCRPVDEALALLATQRAVAGGPLVEETTGYLRAPGWPLLLGVAVGGAAAVALLRRREP